MFVGLDYPVSTSNPKQTVRTEKLSVNKSQQLFCLWNKTGDEGVSTGRKGRRWERARASEGREWTGRAKTETCVGQSAASENPWCIRSHSINTTRSGWCQEDEEKGEEETALGLYSKTAFTGSCGKIDTAWSDCVKVTKQRDRLGGFNECKQLRGDTSGPLHCQKAIKWLVIMLSEKMHPDGQRACIYR